MNQGASSYSPQRHQVQGGFPENIYSSSPLRNRPSLTKGGSPQKVRTGDPGVYQTGVSMRSNQMNFSLYLLFSLGLNAGEIENEDGGYQPASMSHHPTQGSGVYDYNRYQEPPKQSNH